MNRSNRKVSESGRFYMVSKENKSVSPSKCLEVKFLLHGQSRSVSVPVSLSDAIEWLTHHLFRVIFIFFSHFFYDNFLFECHGSSHNIAHIRS